MRHARFAIEDSTKSAELFYQLTFIDLLFSRALLTLERSRPSDVAHRCFDTCNMELILKADGNAMEWADGNFVGGQVCIELFRMRDSVFEENLEQTIGLKSSVFWQRL